MNNKPKSAVIAALLAALVCVATMIIRIPSPLHGYINLGDGVVLLCGWLLSPMYGFLAAGIGSALADILSGYTLYAPITLLLKGGMALIACGIARALHKKPLISKIFGGTLAEIVMIGGYLAFESVLYGFVPSLANVPANAIQGLAGLLVGLILIRIFEKTKLF
ncbi:MAG: ECF transporter S component [Clostridia bacterium]|nr:ECF transporter S component [Clostridia bacterium]